MRTIERVMRTVVNFINMFTCSFYARRSQKRKKLLDMTVFFALLGSAHVNAASKMLMKLTPVRDDECEWRVTGVAGLARCPEGWT